MKTYSLQALLKIKQQHKALFHQALNNAKAQYEAEQKTLDKLLESVNESAFMRSKLDGDFFCQSQFKSCNPNEIFQRNNYVKKSLDHEKALKASLEIQADKLLGTKTSLKVAQNGLLDAHRNLRLLEKHYEAWQQKQLKDQEKEAQYENDDQNGLRYHLRKTTGYKG